MEKFLKSVKGKIIIAAVILLIIAVALCIFFIFNSKTGYRSISISEIYGSVMTENNGKTYEAYKNMRLGDGYALTTDSDSYTRMVLDDDKYVKLEQLSRAVFEQLGNDKKRRTAIRLESGVLTTEITAPLNTDEDFVVNTPNAVLAVRGTFFRVEVSCDESGDAYTNVYTYGGTVACKRIMPDGTIVDEEVLISTGYKARIKMDEVITIYIEELIESSSDNVDPIDVNEITDSDLVDIYNASRNGHEMFLNTFALWKEITDREIDISKYHSVYDGSEIEPFDDEESEDEKSENADEEYPKQNEKPSDTDVLLPWDSEKIEITLDELDEEMIGDNGDYSADGNAFADDYDEEYQNEDSEDDRTYDDKSDPGNNGDSESNQNGSGENSGFDDSDDDSGKTDDAGDDSKIIDENNDLTGADADGNDKSDQSDLEDPKQGENKSENDSDKTGPDSGNASSNGNTNSSSNTSGSSSGGGNPGTNDSEERSGLIYTDNGNIVITSTGYTQGDSEEISYTGSYTITQNSSSAVETTITVESGTHNITLDGVNIISDSNTVYITSKADITLNIDGNSTITATFGNGIHNRGKLTMNSGTLTAYGKSAYAFYNYDGIFELNSGTINAPNGSKYGVYNSGKFMIGNATVNASGDLYGIYNSYSGIVGISSGRSNFSGNSSGICNWNGTFAISGGSVEADGGSSDINTNGGGFTVRGGSLRTIHNTLDGEITNTNGDELECIAYSTFPDESERTFKNSNGTTYVYALSAGDSASDGKYYIWKPVASEKPKNDMTIYMDNGDVTITETGFTQGDSREEIPYTGDYTITQNSSSAVEAMITVNSGTHNITLDGVNIDWSINTYNFFIRDEAEITLNAKGTNIIASGIDNRGTLLFKGGTMDIYCNGEAIVNTGTFEITGGTITASSNVYNSGIDNEGTFKITNGTVNVIGGPGSSSISNRSSGIFEVSGGILNTSAEYSGEISNTGRFTISRGTVNTPEISNQSAGSFEISGGNVTASNNGLYNASNGNFKISGGTVIARSFSATGPGYGIYNDSARFEITGGTVDISGDGHGIYNYRSGVFSISGGSVNVVCESNYGIWNYKAVFEITGGSTEVFNDIRNYDDYTFEVMGGSLHLANGIVTGTITNSNGDELKCKAYEAFPSVSERTFTNSNGTTYVYALTEADKAGDEKYYIWKPVADQESEFDGTIYMDNGSVTIKSTGFTQGDSDVEIPWTDDYTITQEDSSVPINATIAVESGTHNITMDRVNIAANENILTVSAGAVVTLNGNSENTITANVRNGIYNNGTLEISGGTFNVSSNSPGNGRGIFNNSTFKISEGKINVYSELEYGIYNNSGTFEIVGGTVTCSTGIANYGHFEISEGTIDINISVGQSGIQNNMIFEIRGGIVDIFCAPDYAIDNDDEGTFKISGGTVTASGALGGIGNSGVFEISGGIVTATADGGGISDDGILSVEGAFKISGGTVTASSVSGVGLSHGRNGTFEITGGSIEASGNMDISIGSGITFTVTGGSLHAVNGTVQGTITNANGDSLVCRTLSEFPGGSIYVSTGTSTPYYYALSEFDKASDGKYYIWVPEDFTLPGYFSIFGGELVLPNDELPAGDKEPPAGTEQIPEEDKALPPEDEESSDTEDTDPDDDGDEDSENDNDDFHDGGDDADGGNSNENVGDGDKENPL